MGCSLLFQVWNQNGKNPSITYEYTLLRRPHLKNIQPIYYTFSESDSEESQEFDGEESLGFVHHNASFFGTLSKEKIHQENHVFGRQDTAEDMDLGQIQETNEVYERTDTNDCDTALKGKDPTGEIMVAVMVVESGINQVVTFTKEIMYLTQLRHILGYDQLKSFLNSQSCHACQLPVDNLYPKELEYSRTFHDVTRI